MKKGFTLIELMVVVVIIGVLSAIAIPKFASVQDQARRAACRGNMRTLATAEAIYFPLNNTFTSSIGNLDQIQENASFIRCPSRTGAGPYSLSIPVFDEYIVNCPVPGSVHGSVETGVTSWQGSD
ncbi:MAG: Type II secretion system protein G precursor [Deltaproteobacteria bacterium ADurb.Bin072]|nr:MAG: Type II secretion system protein G precursor [Deltaproteobacteria bacterium ADurb.Bin072]